MPKGDLVAGALWGAFQFPNKRDHNLEPANVVDGLFAIALALKRLADGIHRLGTNDASTNRGAIEVLSLEIKNDFDLMRTAISELADCTIPAKPAGD
jgi:hypothetical protein